MVYIVNCYSEYSLTPHTYVSTINDSQYQNLILLFLKFDLRETGWNLVLFCDVRRK